MFREILKVIPTLDSGATNKMVNNLNARFKTVAKKFGSGLKNVLLGGGVVGTVMAVLDKILNPLQKAQQALDDVLNRSDDLDTYAKEFNTSTGKLFKLQQLAGAKGVDPQQLNQLLGKFQGAISEAIADPSKESAVRKFAVPGQDSADMFFHFIQSLNKLPNEMRTMVEQEVFGEKLSLKSAEFLNVEDFEKLSKMLGLAAAEEYTRLIRKGADIADTRDIVKTKRDTDNYLAQLRAAQPSNVKLEDINQRVKQGREQQALRDYNALANVDTKMEKIASKFDKVLEGMAEGLANSEIGYEGIIKELKKLPTALKWLIDN